ncbi:MAG: hypothetical protein ACLUSV_00355 [Streptococcus sp.]|uniref:Uncharacterized protein n=1 Tax=Siphoviridae sp. ctqSm5 TaxID=2827949 RepID=A0A8S5SP25_9CAUD|nr:MAG TPA: hypothetical protein [Siphoviridae sp. ctqSm5]
MQLNYVDMANEVVKYVQENSVVSGFQLCVTIDNLYDCAIDPQKLIEELECCDEVADVVYEDGVFDVLLYTKYALNNNELEEEWE